MSACAPFRGWILPSLEYGLGHGAALDLARHLALCPRCRRERERHRSLAQALDRLPEVAPPASFPSVVMRRIRHIAPAIRKTGACVVLALSLLAGAAAMRLPHSPGGLIPQVRLDGGEAWGSEAGGFGRAAFAILSNALLSPPAGGGSAVSGLAAWQLPLTLVLAAAGLVLLAGLALVASSPLLLYMLPPRQRPEN